MSTIAGWAGRVRGLFTDTKGPWGASGSGDEPPGDDHGAGPWGEPPARGSSGAAVASRRSTIFSGAGGCAFAAAAGFREGPTVR